MSIPPRPPSAPGRLPGAGGPLALALGLLALGLTPAGRVAAGPPEGLTPEAVREQQTTFKAERAAGGADKFSPEWQVRADALAKQADEALAGNRLVEARDLLR